MSKKKIGRYIFIGLGGSGGKTLQYLYNNLEIKLSSVKKTMPEGWQFLWIDVPQDQDALDTGTGIKPLSDRFYQPLAKGDATFNSYDFSLRRKHLAIQNHLAGWSPEAERIDTEIIDGAGQFRAIGRIITMKSYKDIHNRISDIFTNMENAKVKAELDDIDAAINPNQEDDTSGYDHKPPMVIFISSLAGGSGSGSTMDVADIVRSVVDNQGINPDQSVGLLYTPDIFLGEPDLEGNSIIYVNSLFAISEIISGWHDSDKVQPDSDIWNAFDMLPPSSRRRGPRYNILIGRGNKKITFNKPIDIYRNTGKLLSEWCLNPSIDFEIRAYLLTNWEARSDDQPTNTGLSNNVSDSSKPYDPFNSLGYSSVSLGREFFRKYAEERVAKLAINHLVKAHWDNDTGVNKTKEKALSEATERILSNEILFNKSGLNTDTKKDKSQDIKKIEKSIQSKISTPQSDAIKAKYVEKIFEFATSDNQQRTKDDWAEKFTNTFNNEKGTFFEEVEKEHIENAQNWVKSFNIEFVNFISDTVSEHGAPVALNFVTSLSSRLNEALHKNEENDKGLYILRKYNQSWADSTFEQIKKKLNQVGDDSIGKAHNLMGSVKVQISNQLQFIIDENILKIVSDLVEGVDKEVLPAIRATLNEMISKGNTNLDESIDQGYGKIVSTWPDLEPTDAVEGSENEVLVEDTDHYVEKFEELLNKTYKEVGKRNKDALTSLYKDVLRGSKYPENIDSIKDEKQIQKILNDCLMSIEKLWIPEKSYLNKGAAPQTPTYRINVDIYGIKDRATKILVEDGNPFGTYINESLDDYLDENKSSHEEFLSKKTKFEQAFRKALSYSLPQIFINSSLQEDVHGKPEENVLKVSPIGISSNKIREMLKEELLPYFNNSEENVNKLFTSQIINSQSITFFSHYKRPKDISVVKSLWKPIIEKWISAKANNKLSELYDFWLHKRSRPLEEFVPLHPENIESLIKGFFIARLMNIYKTNRESLIKPNDYLIAEVEVENFGFIKFPHPLIEPRPDAQDELGSLILSIPISIGLVSTDVDKNALKPYERLIELGANNKGLSEKDGISMEFNRFLKEKSNEEVKEILNRTQTFLNGYKEIASYEIYSDNLNKFNRRPGLGWEIAPKIVTILESLIVNIENSQKDLDSGSTFEKY